LHLPIFPLPFKESNMSSSSTEIRTAIISGTNIKVVKVAVSDKLDVFTLARCLTRHTAWFDVDDVKDFLFSLSVHNSISIELFVDAMDPVLMKRLSLP
jgi:hypothetical protein